MPAVRGDPHQTRAGLTMSDLPLIDARAFEPFLQMREQAARDFEFVCRPLVRDGKRAHRRLWDLIHLGNIRSGVPMPRHQIALDGVGHVPGLVGIREGHDWYDTRYGETA